MISSHYLDLCSVLFLMYALYNFVQVLSSVLVVVSDVMLLVCLLNMALWLDIELVLTTRYRILPCLIVSKDK